MGLPQSSYDTTKTRVHVIRVEIEAGWMSVLWDQRLPSARCRLETLWTAGSIRYSWSAQS